MFSIRKSNLFYFCLASLVLASCATTQKNACTHRDWKAQGVEDGKSGKPVSELKTHEKICKKFGVIADATAYNEGHREGLGQYCLPGNALKMGRSGRAYDNVCPKEEEKSFLAKYQVGKEMYELENLIKGIQKDLEDLEIKLSENGRSPDELRQLHTEQRRLERQAEDYRRRLTTIEVKEDIKDN